jgi:hypothetical protein
MLLVNAPAMAGASFQSYSGIPETAASVDGPSEWDELIEKFGDKNKARRSDLKETWTESEKFWNTDSGVGGRIFVIITLAGIALFSPPGLLIMLLLAIFLFFKNTSKGQ